MCKLHIASDIIIGAVIVPWQNEFGSATDVI